MAAHKVRPGESVQSLALRFGLLPETIWDHPSNADLKNKRKEQGILAPGDEIEIPSITQKTVTAAIDQQHRFRIKGRTLKFRMRFLINDEPRADEPCVIDIDGVEKEGVTDGDGWIEEQIPVFTKQVRVVFDDRDDDEDPDDIDEHVFHIGHLDPLEEDSGLQGRLQNLGFYDGEIDGDVGEVTAAALRAFQRHAGIAETGEIDDATRDALRKDYGS